MSSSGIHEGLYASLVGRVVATVLRGRTVFKDGQPPHAPCGTVLLRRGGAF